jgi:hypothetical protein
VKDAAWWAAAIAALAIAAYLQDKEGPHITDIPPDEALLTSWIEED